MAFSHILPKTKISQKISLALRIGLLALFVFCPNFAQARVFNPHNIITDSELLNKDSLTKTAIQVFLERENSVLARYSQVIDGRTLKASEMIWQIGQKHGISPKFLLTTVEKEQGLIHKSQATEKALDWAAGYGCYGGSCKDKYQGFYNQVEAAAETQQIYWQKADQLAFSIGKTTVTFDGYPVTPENKATANFYIYTPYVGYAPELGVTKNNGGNKLFWRIWHRYFTSQKFLDGQVMTDGTNYWLIQSNLKRKFVSKNIFLADYKEIDAILVSMGDLAAYPDGAPISFAENTLVKSAVSGQIYLLAQGQKRPLSDSSALARLTDFRLALSATEIPAVGEELLSPYAQGQMITANSTYPQGKLFRDESGKIWLAQENLKHEVDPAVWQNRYQAKFAEPLASAELDKYAIGSPILLKDGTFVTIDGNYYLISGNERMKIENAEIFDHTFGPDKRNNVLTVSAALLAIHPAGEMIDYVDETVQDAIIGNSAQSSNVPAGSLQAEISSLEPDSLIVDAGQTQAVTLKIKNSGTAAWQPGEVWLKVTDENASSTYGVLNQVNFSESSVGPSQTATFTFNLAIPGDQAGIKHVNFDIYYNAASPQTLVSASKFAIIKTVAGGAAAKTGADKAEIVSQNIPTALKNTSKPVMVTVKIKNTSKNTSWLSKRTALEIYNLNGSTSYFYDKNDWIRKEVAAVPVNSSVIKPGETGIFKFTLDPRNIKAGTYTLNIQLKLLDKNKQVTLSGQASWQPKIKIN